MKSSLPDTNQSFWSLASIQAVSTGIVDVMMGRQLAFQSGIFRAIVSIIFGNLILWIVGLVVVLMAYKTRKNAVEISQDYVGRTGSLLMAVVLLVSILIWYTIQLETTASSYALLVGDVNTTLRLRIGTVAGCICTLLAFGGIKLIRRISVAALPLILAFLVYAIIRTNPNTNSFGMGPLTLGAVAYVVGTNLVGYVMFPTFFRHSKSRPDAIIGLACLTVLTAFIQAAGIWIDGEVIAQSAGFVFNFIPQMGIDLPIIVTYMVLSLIAVNLVNLYFASAGWETVMPFLHGKRALAVMGLIGTVFFVTIPVGPLSFLLQNITGGMIAALGTVLIISYLIQLIVQHRPRQFQLVLNLICWLFGCVVVVMSAFGILFPNKPLIAIGALSSTTLYIVIIFIEEIIWSYGQLGSTYDESS